MTDFIATQKAAKLKHKERFRAWVKRYNDLGVACDLCKGCLKKHKEYDGGSLPARCNLSTELQYKEEESSGFLNELDDSEKIIYESSKDPVTWAEMMFKWTAREYQKDMLRCSAQKKVSRCGRRIGKTDALAVDILHKCFTKPGKKPTEAYKVLIICPYERQVTAIFKRIRILIGESEDLRNSIRREISNPQEIEFENNSTILGIPAGVRTGAKADQVRGQDADYVVLDEADYLDEGSLDSIMAVFASKSSCLLWASSTPSGRREHFFKWCTEPTMGFKQFHYASDVSPEWTDETELFFRQMYSSSAYEREFEAEFGEEEGGVFQHQYIEASLLDYEVSLCKRNLDNLYCMGVDWNSTSNGTHIVIVEYDTLQHHFKVVLKEVIQAREFTQHEAISRIIEIDQKWNCDYIYVDAGFGTTQVEFLREYGMKYPRSKMHKKLKPVDFGSKTTIRDPVSKQIVKKHTKPLVVEISARRMEVGQCIIPQSEDSGRGLVRQMRNFVVERFGRDGQPVYTNENEHTLIAWMLGVFGLVMEFTELTRIKNVTRVQFADIWHRHDINNTQDVHNAAKKIKDKRRELTPMPRWVESTSRTPDTTLNQLGITERANKMEQSQRRSNLGRPGAYRPHDSGRGRSTF